MPGLRIVGLLLLAAGCVGVETLTQFRACHQGRAGEVLADLRERYNHLLLKVLSLLQGSDPVLAQAIAGSREAIWGVLADPVKFARL